VIAAQKRACGWKA